MSGHSSEEKLKILYEDSLREIRELTDRMEAMSQSNAETAKFIVEVKNNLLAENEQLLMGAIVEIKNAVAQIVGAQINIIHSASNTVHVLLNGKGGVIQQQEYLVNQLHEILERLSKTADSYKSFYITKPLLLSFIVGGVVGGFVVGFAYSIVKWQ